MKLSEITKQALEALTEAQILRILFDGCGDEGESADVALLLGSRPSFCKSRAEKAAELYRQGRVPYIVPSGGVVWDSELGRMTETEYMTEILKQNGVPEEAIIPENEATTTKENMLFGAIQINRRLKFQKVRKVCIVTSTRHMRRSMALARWLLPRGLVITNAPSGACADAYLDETDEKLMRNEVALMWNLIQHGLIEDIEF